MGEFFKRYNPAKCVMQTRRFPINTRYLSASVTLGGPGAENPEGLRVFCFDNSMRPILALRCASTGESFGACEDFFFLVTPFTALRSRQTTWTRTRRASRHTTPYRLYFREGMGQFYAYKLPTREGIYHSLLTLLTKLGPLQYFTPPAFSYTQRWYSTRPWPSL